MKELIILRHAKSNREYAVDDIDRPLSVAGIERIKKISQKKGDVFKNADIIVSSPANRALHTAQLMMQELGFPYQKLIIDKKLYTFYVNDVIDYVHFLDNQWTKVILVGHNPAFTELVNHFSEKKITHLRTAGLVKISFSTNDWSTILQGDMELGQNPAKNYY